MSSLSSIYIKKETLATLLKVVNAKEEKGVEITVSIFDESNEYGQNVSAFVAQSEEQRKSGLKKFYVGNGKCFWTDGKITKAEKKEQIQEAQVINEPKEDDLPF